jgi:Fic family protein
VPLLAHAAIAHAQFETIHPFADGNGRTGRALMHAQLRNKGLTQNVTVPISAGLLSDVDTYFSALTTYRTGDPRPIVERVAHAAFAAIDNGRILVSDLSRLRDEWEGRLRLRRNASAWRLLEVLARHPVVNARLLATELGITPQNVYRSLKPLIDAEIVIEFTDQKRNQLWRAPDVLDALDRFAQRAGRRRVSE